MNDNTYRPKYERLKENIRAKIKDGEWRAGDKIFPERIIAEKYGISRITVKKAISDLIAEGVLEHIKGKKGTFVKNAKDNLNTTNLIGVAIDDIGDSFGAKMLMGIEDFLWEKRFHPVVCNVERNFKKVEEYFISILKNNIAGVVFAPIIGEGYINNNLKIINLLKNRNIPFVLIDRYIEGLSSNFVICNYRESIRNVVEKLINKGHKKILLALGTECSGIEEGFLGYKDALKIHSIKYEDKLVIRLNDNLLYKSPDQKEVKRMKELIENAGDFTAFLALNGRLLKTGISIFLSKGIKIGKDIELASHGDVSYIFPPYTNNIIHVVQPAYDMGWEAAKILLSSIKHPDRAVIQMILKSSIVNAS